MHKRCVGRDPRRWALLLLRQPNRDVRSISYHGLEVRSRLPVPQRTARALGLWPPIRGARKV